MIENAKRDENRVSTIIAVSEVDGVTPVRIHANPTTNALLVEDQSGGGGGDSGVQYTEGDTDASITGTAIMWEDTSDTLKPVSATSPLPVSVTGGGDATAANQSTIIGHVDGIETLLGTIDTDTGNIATDTAAIKTAVEGTLTVDGSGVTQPVSGTVTAELSATDNAVLDQIELNQDSQTAILTTIDQDTGAIRTAVETLDNAISGSEMQVDVVASLPSGTNAIGKLAANDGVDVGDVTVNNAAGSGVYVRPGTSASFTVAQSTASNLKVEPAGNVAHDGVDSGNPIKFGGRAQNPLTDLEEVADNDRVDAAFDRQGRLATWMGYPVQSAVINTSTSGDNTVVAAAGAGKRIALLGCVIISDGTTDVRWEDGASGTAKTGQIPLQAREGFVMPIGPQPWFVGSANTLLNLELTAAINVHGIASYIVMED